MVPCPWICHTNSVGEGAPAGEPLLTRETIEHVTAVVEQHGSDAWWQMELEDLLPEALRAGGRVLLEFQYNLAMCKGR